MTNLKLKFITQLIISICFFALQFFSTAQALYPGIAEPKGDDVLNYQYAGFDRSGGRLAVVGWNEHKSQQGILQVYNMETRTIEEVFIIKDRNKFEDRKYNGNYCVPIPGRHVLEAASCKPGSSSDLWALSKNFLMPPISWIGNFYWDKPLEIEFTTYFQAPDSDYIFAVRDWYWLIYHKNSNKPIRFLNENRELLLKVCFNAEGRRFKTIGQSHERLWELETGALISSKLRDRETEISSCKGEAYEKRKKFKQHFLKKIANKETDYINSSGRNTPVIPQGKWPSVRFVHHSPEFNKAVSIHDDNRIRIWSVNYESDSKVSIKSISLIDDFSEETKGFGWTM